MFSDVHLGRDLPADGPPTKPRRVDHELAAMLEHYRTRPPASGRWRIVIAGDFIDFIGMTVRANGANGEALETALSDEEHEHGLGSAADHARLKLGRVIAGHAQVFAALGRFVADGHAVSFVHGNHDVELYWEVVQSDLRSAIARHAAVAGADAEDAATRVEFCPWFYWADGVAYIEHGHQYDTYCANEHVMAPVSPLDARRLSPNFSEVLLRYVVRPTRGLPEHGHESMGVPDYIAFALKLDISGGWTLASRFASAVAELFRLRRAYLTEAATVLYAEHKRRMSLLAEARRIGLDRLEALAALSAPPVTRSIRQILASVLLDRLALGLASSLALLAIALVGLRHGHVWWGAIGVLAAWSTTHRHLARTRTVDPREALLDRAGALAKLFPAAFVVMGHTHAPAKVPVSGGAATYVNLGAWADDDPAEDAPEAARAPRTHLVIRVGERGPTAELLAWDATGPRRYVSPEVMPSLPPPSVPPISTRG